MRSGTNPGSGWPFGSSKAWRGRELPARPTGRKQEAVLALSPPQAHDSRSMRLMQVQLPPGQTRHDVRCTGLCPP